MCKEPTVGSSIGTSVVLAPLNELAKHITPVNLGLQYLSNKTFKTCRHLAHHLGGLCRLCNSYLPLCRLLFLLSRGTITILAVIHWVIAVIIFRQQVVDTLGRTITCLVKLWVVQSLAGHLADVVIGQQLVDYIVTCLIPSARATSTTSEVVFKHRVEALMGNEELDLLIGQRLDKPRVVLDVLAIGCRRWDVVIEQERQVQGNATDERMLQHQGSTSLDDALVLHRLLSIGQRRHVFVFGVVHHRCWHHASHIRLP